MRHEDGPAGPFFVSGTGVYGSHTARLGSPHESRRSCACHAVARTRPGCGARLRAIAGARRELPARGAAVAVAAGMGGRRGRARRADPQVRRTLHHPSGGGGAGAGRAGPGRGDPGRRDPARHHRGHAAVAPGPGRAVRRDRGRAGRWRHQARQAALRRPPGSRRGEFPQDAAGDVARPAGHPDQARRPPAQHAHAGRAIR